MLCLLSQAYISLQPVLLRVAPLELDTRYVITTTQAATLSCDLSNRQFHIIQKGLIASHIYNYELSIVNYFQISNAD